MSLSMNFVVGSCAWGALARSFEKEGTIQESASIVSAVDKDAVKEVYQWLKNGNSPYQRIRNKLKESLLDRAAHRGSFKTATLLLRVYRYDHEHKSPNLEIVDGRGTPLIVNLAGLANPGSSRASNYEKLVARMARLFPHSVNDTDHAYLGDGRSALHQAAAIGNLKLVQILINKNAQINIQNKAGETPLHLAAQFGHLNVARYLIQKRAELNITTRHTQETPLMVAAENGQEMVMAALINAGARKDLKDTFGKSAQVRLEEYKKRLVNKDALVPARKAAKL